MFGYESVTPREKYWVVLVIVAALVLLAKNMARGSVGRGWMAVRDMDVAAEAMGLSLLRTKLQAFAISSFYCGVGGALFAFAYLQTVEPSAFTIICPSKSCSWSSWAVSERSWGRSSAPASSC